VSRPGIDTDSVLACWDAENVRTVELYAGAVGGYITLRALPEGDVLVTLFRLHDKVRVRVEEGHLAPPETDNPQGASD
jgi:hypothetical protein